jgi:hypothetical protein
MSSPHTLQSSDRAGIFVAASTAPEGYAAFMPHALPPEPPPLITPGLQRLLDCANQAIGRLDGTRNAAADPRPRSWSFAVARLHEVGILREVTGRQRGGLYVYDDYLQLLNEGTTDGAP